MTCLLDTTKKHLHSLTASLALFLPYKVFAVPGTNSSDFTDVETPTDFASLVDLFLGIVNLAVPFIFAVVFVFLVWKIIDSWVINAADQNKRAEGKQYALLAVLVFVLMISTWGIVTMLRLSIFG